MTTISKSGDKPQMPQDKRDEAEGLSIIYFLRKANIDENGEYIMPPAKDGSAENPLFLKFAGFFYEDMKYKEGKRLPADLSPEEEIIFKRLKAAIAKFSLNIDKGGTQIPVMQIDPNASRPPPGNLVSRCPDVNSRNNFLTTRGVVDSDELDDYVEKDIKKYLKKDSEKNKNSGLTQAEKDSLEAAKTLSTALTQAKELYHKFDIYSYGNDKYAEQANAVLRKFKIPENRYPPADYVYFKNYDGTDSRPLPGETKGSNCGLVGMPTQVN